MADPSHPSPLAARHTLIDALRGVALLGIVLVNIQSFAWGISAPTMGMLWDDATKADETVVYLTTFLLAYKFYPIFCFCFGYGFAMMVRRWRVGGLPPAAIRIRFTRRLNFMFWLGVLHGCLIWFGDILARYALAGYLLRAHLSNDQRGPRAILRAIKFWAVITLLLAALNALLSATFGTSLAASSTDIEQMMRVFERYAYADYTHNIAPRITDYGWVMLSWLMVFPQAVLLFLVGALVAQLGWLRNPARHADKWRRILFGALLLGLPWSWLMAADALTWSLDPSAASNLLGAIALSLAPLLAPAYVAGMALGSLTKVGAIAVRLLAPMGRLALTNYLAQSVLMSVLLAGHGFGWADAGQSSLAGIALAIWLALLLFSHVYLRFRTQGPAEWAWRRHTNKLKHKQLSGVSTENG